MAATKEGQESKLLSLKERLVKICGPKRQLKKHFMAWDAERKGHISLQNTMIMCNLTLGAEMTIDDCRLVIAAASKGKSSTQMHFDDFIEMLYSPETTFDPNKVRIPEVDPAEVEKAQKGFEEERNCREFLSQNNERSAVRQDKKLNFIFLRKLEEIQKRFSESDEVSRGTVSLKKMEEIFDKLHIHESVLGLKERREIFEKFKRDEVSFNYKAFVENVKEFKLETEKENPFERLIVERKERRIKEEIGEVPKENREGSLLDYEQLGLHKLEKLARESCKIASMFRRFYRNKKELKEFLENEMNIPSGEIDNALIPKEKLQGVFAGFFRSIGETLSNEAQQAFFALLPHNPKNKSLTFSEFARIIYE